MLFTFKVMSVLLSKLAGKERKCYLHINAVKFSFTSYSIEEKIQPLTLLLDLVLFYNIMLYSVTTYFYRTFSKLVCHSHYKWKLK